MTKLLRAISATDLIAYFEWLDEVRACGQITPANVERTLMKRWPGMTNEEAHDVGKAWTDTFSHTLPAEDRALNALEAA